MLWHSFIDATMSQLISTAMRLCVQTSDLILSDGGGGVNHHHNIQVLFASTLHQMMRPTQLGAAQGDSPMTPFLMLGATPDPKIKATIWVNQYTELGTLVTTTEPVVSWSINPQNQPPLTSVTHPRASRITTIGQ